MKLTEFYSITSLPGLTSLKAASAAKWAAIMASAFLPVILDFPSLMMTVWATTAMKPSICAPMSILTTSPSCITTSGSLFKGEKWQMVLLTETQQGKAIPFWRFLSFLNAFPVSSSILLSALIQVSRTEAPALHKATVSFRIPAKKIIHNESAKKKSGKMIRQCCCNFTKFLDFRFQSQKRWNGAKRLTVHNLSCHFVFGDNNVLSNGGNLVLIATICVLFSTGHGDEAMNAIMTLKVKVCDFCSFCLFFPPDCTTHGNSAEKGPDF